jgi:hypothetical protein
MIRDITMIFSVIVSLVSIAFGVYKNIEAGNAQSFAYEQAYRMMSSVQQANISETAKSFIVDNALAALSVPPPVIDLSRSSADDSTPQICSDEQRSICRNLAEDLASANATCIRGKGVSPACGEATGIKQEITAQSCIMCYDF